MTLEEQIDAHMAASAQAPASVNLGPQAAPMGLEAEIDAHMAANAPKERSGMDYAANAAAGINRGIIELLDLPSTVVNTALGAAQVPENWRFPKLQDVPYIDKGINRVIPKGESMVADALYTAGRWGSGAAIAPTKVAMIPDALAATGAVIGEAIGGETGEVVGGLTGAFSPLALQKTAALIRKGRHAFRGQNPDIDEETHQVMEFLKANTSNADEAELAIREAVKRGEKGSVSDLSRDPKLSAVEQAAMSEPDLREALLPIHRERDAQVAGRVDDLVGTVTDAPQQVASGRLNKALGRVNKLGSEQTARAESATAGEVSQSQLAQTRATAEADIANMQARQADEALGGTGRTDQSSIALSDEYDDLEKALREGMEQPAWEKFDNAPPIEVGAMKAEVRALLDELPPSQQLDVRKTYSTLLNHIEKMGDVAEPREVQYVLSAIKDINNTAKNAGSFGTLNKSLADVSKVVDARLRNDPTGTGVAFRNAIEATVQKHRELGGARTSKARLKDPELVGGALGFKGDAGAVTMRNIADSADPVIMRRAEDHLRNAIRKDGVSEKTLENYAPALDYFPKLKQQLRQSVTAQAKAGDVGAASKATIADEASRQTKATSLLAKKMNEIKATARGRKSNIKGLSLSKYAGSPNKYIKGLLNSPDDTGELGRLYTRMKKDGAGEAFKSQALSQLRDDALKVTDMTSENADKLFKSLQRLEANGIVSKADMKEVSDILSMREGKRLRMAGGRTTSTEAANDMMDDAIATVMTLPLLSALPSSHQLMTMGILKRNFKWLLKRKHADPKVMKRLGQILKSPELYLSAVDGKITKTSTPAEMDKFFRGVVRAMAHEDDK